MTQFRIATPEDADDVARLDEHLMAVHRRAWPHLFAENPTGQSDPPHWLSELQSSQARVFVAERDGTIVGFVSVRLAVEGHAHLRPMKYALVPSLVVAEPYRSMGIGSRLMALAEEWSTSEGAQEARLSVWAFNEGALHLYQAGGYQVRAHFLGKPLTAADAR
ncbi:MAG: GNAT family N-acetyltransferase [Proteobacteria bacterium]|nr:GNAT family N-acetyltransferase [Pseudomonadota bacterium]